MLKPKQVKPIDIREIFTILKKRIWMIIIPVIIVTAMAYGATYFIPPQYQSSTIIWIDKPSNVSSELERILGGTTRRETRDEQYNKRLAIETELTSQGYLIQLIQNLNLDDDPDISRDAAKMREENPDVPLEQIKTNLLIQHLRESISVGFHGTDQIVINVVSEDPRKARDIAAQLAEILDKGKNPV